MRILIQNAGYLYVVLIGLPFFLFGNTNESFLVKEDLYNPPLSCKNIIAKPRPAAANMAMWSHAETWGGTKPVAGEVVTIPSGLHVILDENPPALGGLILEGTLEFAQQDLVFSADYILITGLMQIGSEALPFTHQAVVNLTGTNTQQNIAGMGTRGIMVMGGALELHGMPTAIPYTKINAHAPEGSTNLELIENVDWQTDDQIIISPTDYYEAGNSSSITQRVGLVQVSDNQIVIGEELNAHRWGLLQYATNNGMSLIPDNLVVPNEESTPTILDERAYIGHLTRNIIIQSPDDDLWQNNGFGCHIMIMRDGNNVQGVAHVNGIEIRRGGQLGNLGRYPFHWHMLSYEGTQTLSDATGQYLRNSSINRSANRGIVIHGTNGVEVSQNVVYDTRGHAVFTEDAAERRNLIDGNLVLHVRNPSIPLKQHEADGNRSSSGFWISNPDNIVTNNIAGDCNTNGFWLAFPEHPWGLSINVPLIPNRLQFGVFDRNVAFSNRLEGVMLDNVEIDANGNTFPRQYISTTDGQQPSWPFPTIRRFTISRYQTWKNSAHGVWDRSVWVDNFEVVAADNQGRYFAGSGEDGLIERSLVVGTSLNHLMNGTDRPNFTGEVTPAAFATYHSTFDIQNNIVINFPEIAETMSGVYATNDYYLRPVEKGQIRNTGNIIINSDPGVKLNSGYEHFALAGAIWDPNNDWSNLVGTNNYLVYDTPFFTYNQTPTPVYNTTNGVLVQGPYYGFNDFVVNQGNIRWEDFMALSVDRLDTEFNEVGHWEIGEAQNGWLLAHMRHFAAHTDGYFRLEFPTIETVSDVAMSVENMLETTDDLLLAIEYSGDYLIEHVLTTTNYFYDGDNILLAPASAQKHVYQPVANRQEVIDSNGETYWQDAANNLVWIKIAGGLQEGFNPDDYEPHDDERLYERFYLRVAGSEAPLVADLLDLSATLKANKTVQLNWNSTSGITNQSFQIERSADGKIWKTIGTVLRNVDESNGVHYEFLDQYPLTNLSYYRLHWLDAAKRKSFSPVVTIVNAEKEEITIFPNPTSDILYINSIEEIKLAEVLNQQGQLIKRVTITQEEISVVDLPKGVYWLRLVVDNQWIMQKFLKW